MLKFIKRLLQSIFIDIVVTLYLLFIFIMNENYGLTGVLSSYRF